MAAECMLIRRENAARLHRNAFAETALLRLIQREPEDASAHHNLGTDRRSIVLHADVQTFFLKHLADYSNCPYLNG